MKNFLIKHYFIYSILLSICSIASAADLEEDLKELSTASDLVRKRELIASILISPKLYTISSLGLTLAQYEAIFAALRDTNTNYSEGPFINLFEAALLKYREIKNSYPLANTALAFAEYLPRFDNRSIYILRFKNDYYWEIKDLILDALDAIFANENNLELLVGILEWKYLDPKFQAHLFKEILMHKNLLEAVQKLKNFGDVDDAQKAFITYFMTHSADWLMHVGLLLTILEEKETPPQESKWRGFLPSQVEHILKQLDADLAQGLKFSRYFKDILGDFNHNESLEEGFNL